MHNIACPEDLCLVLLGNTSKESGLRGQKVTMKVILKDEAQNRYIPK